MNAGYVSQDQRRAAADRIEVYARSMCAIQGLPAPGPEVLSPIIDSTMAGLTAHQQRHPDAIPLAALGDLHQALLRVSQTNKAVNLYGAEAPADGKGDRGFDKSGLKGGDAMDRMRGVSLAARYRDADGGASDSGGRSSNAGSSHADGGARYDSIGPAEWNTPKGLALTRGYALGNGMAWATKQPDLMRMGQPAIQALHDAKLKGDGYEALHGREHLNFDNKTIVAGAEYMKRNKANYDDAAKAAAAVDGLKQLSPEERALHRETERGLLISKPGEPERAAKQRYLEMGDKLIEHHHGDKQVTSTVERERKAHHVQKQRELKAEAGAKTGEKGSAIKVAKADLHTATAATHVAKADQHVAQANQRVAKADQKVAQNQQLAQTASQAGSGRAQAKAALGADLG